MYDVKVLEEEWKKYRRKKRLPLYIGVFAALTLVMLLLYFEFFSKKAINQEEKYLVKNNDAVKVQKRIEKENTLLSNVEKIESNLSSDKPVEAIVEDIPVLDEENIQESQKENKGIKPRKKLHLDIVDASNLDAYREVEARFFKYKDIEDSLFLAKSYYKKGLYKKSEYWALQTNSVNSMIDESWIIFALSRMKQGHKKEAINILKKYIKRTDSENAKNVLLKIQAGM